jgi:hypothetical protein
MMPHILLRAMDEDKHALEPFNHPELPAEVRFTEMPLIARLATYTRSCFARRPYRIFISALPS